MFEIFLFLLGDDVLLFISGDEEDFEYVDLEELKDDLGKFL